MYALKGFDVAAREISDFSMWTMTDTSDSTFQKTKTVVRAFCARPTACAAILYSTVANTAIKQNRVFLAGVIYQMNNYVDGEDGC